MEDDRERYGEMERMQKRKRKGFGGKDQKGKTEAHSG